MSRYVDLNNPKIFHNGRDKFGNGIYHIPPDLPADDVVERRKGKWIYREPLDVFECSVCGSMMVRNIFNYCPWCGAYMRERKEE